MSEDYRSLAEVLDSWIGRAATSIIAALVGRVVWHTQEVRKHRRQFFGRELIWERPIAIAMAFVGEALAAWLNAGDPIRTGIVAALAYLGPRGCEALFGRWFGGQLRSD